MKLSRRKLRNLTGCQAQRPGKWVEHRHWTQSGIHCFDGVIECDLDPLPARVLCPLEKNRNGAAVLYGHAHGNRYEIGMTEVSDGRPSLLQPPVGLWLASLGYVVLCPEMPGFGRRQSEGTESELSKKALWHGRPLLGLMLDDMDRAYSALSAFPGIERGRVATFGLSMGATLSYWHAALNPDIARCSHLCAFSSIGELIRTGAHDLHGIYMTVPGLLPNYDMGDVAALIAPRQQFIGAGYMDPLTPQAAFEPAFARVTDAYARNARDLKTFIEPNGGHAETTGMRAALKQFLAPL